MIPTIELVDGPGPEIGTAIGAPLRRFNRQQTGSSETARLLALTILAPGSDDIIGGLWGESGWGHLHIDLLVVPEEMRGTGVGRTLMRWCWRVRLAWRRHGRLGWIGKPCGTGCTATTTWGRQAWSRVRHLDPSAG